MGVRTDLALDISDALPENRKAIKKQRETGKVKSTVIEIKTKEERDAYRKPPGTYITVEFPPLLTLTEPEETENAVFDALQTLYKEKKGPLLVAGLGNTDITADSVGPKTASRLLATRHIYGSFADRIGLTGLQSVAVLSPGVLGKTGIETAELLFAAASAVKPAAILVIDALASGSISRLFQTVQLCDSGISPGSGVKNARKEISRKTMGVPVIAVGVPTVVDAGILARELTGNDPSSPAEMVVTPKDADLLCEKISDLLAAAINRFLQPALDAGTLKGLL